jgi:hypothetical protein
MCDRPVAPEEYNTVRVYDKRCVYVGYSPKLEELPITI